MADGLDADQFAQTRGDDDLFDDEIIPVPATAMTTEVEEDVITQQMEELELQQYGPDLNAPASLSPEPVQDGERERDNARNGGYRSRGNARGNKRGASETERGRGRGRRRGGAGGRNNFHVQTTQSSPTPPILQDQEQARNNDGAASLDGRSGEYTANETVTGGPSSSAAEAQGEGTDGKELPESHGTPVRSNRGNGPGTPKVQSVRGDRSGTGGIKKPKLTEEELSQRMAAAKLKAAELSAAHDRAKADEAIFEEREKIAHEKRLAENQNRRALEGERERNRMRKLGAQTGREWDAEKREEDYTQRNNRGSGFRRGAHGSVVNDRRGAGTTSTQEAFGADNYSHNGDGYQYRGRGRGRGRGPSFRGGRGGSHGDKHSSRTADDTQLQSQPIPSVDAETEFPSLPAANPTYATTAPPTSAISTGPVPGATAESSSGKSPMTPITPQGSWAEQVESSQSFTTKSSPPASQPQEQAAT